MKPLTAIAASALILTLMVAPAFAATTVTVSVDSASYTGTAAVHVTGTVSPAPGPSQSVFIQVTNPSGQTFPVGTASVDASSGAFSLAFNTGGTYFTTSGTYTVHATFGAASGQATFSYTATGGTTGGVGGISQAQFNDIMGNLSQIKTLLNGISSTQTSQGSQLNSIQSALTALTTTVGGIQSSLSNVAGQVGSINTAVGGISSQLSSLSGPLSTAGSTQTYVLVVAVLAAITLVLELAILVRKLS